MKFCLGFVAYSVIGIFVLILFFLIQQTLPFFQAQFFFSFFQSEWYPLEGFYGQLPMIIGSLYICALAMLIGVSFGLSSAIVIAFFTSGKTQGLIEFLVELLAGIPSVIFGLWGLTAIVPWAAQYSPPGTNLLVTALVLGMMIMPLFCVSALASFYTIPKQYMINAKALGISRMSFIIHIALPHSAKHLASGSILASVRALGETLVVMMIAGNIAKIPFSLFDPVRSLTSNIALEMAYAMDVHRSSLYASGLVLTLLVFLLVSVQTKYLGKNHNE